MLTPSRIIHTSDRGPGYYRRRIDGRTELRLVLDNGTDHLIQWTRDDSAPDPANGPVKPALPIVHTRELAAGPMIGPVCLTRYLLANGVPSGASAILSLASAWYRPGESLTVVVRSLKPRPVSPMVIPTLFLEWDAINAH